MVAEVYLWGTKIGTVAQKDAADIAKFQYDKDFLKSGIEVSPIVMPLSNRIYSFPALSQRTFHNLPGLLADSLPDKYGTKLIERHLAEQGRNINSFSAVEKLCYIGKRGMGALEFVPAMSESVTDSSVDINALVKLASDILCERESVLISADNDMMEQIIKVGTSAGGARAKAIVAWNEQTNDIRSGQIEAGSGYGYWLIKFDGVENNKDKGDKADGPSYTRIEYAYSLMAKAAGIIMSECRLYQESGNYHFMTKRFDRELESGRKIHMQTLGAMAHFDYNEPGAYSYEQAAAIVYQLGMQQAEIEQLFRRMVFNVVSRNQDDHVKNISFLMDRKGTWSLSPAYDITYANDENNFWLKRHQMSINGKFDNFTRDDIYQCGRKMNISKGNIEKIITEVSAAISEWQKYSEEAQIKEQVYEEIRTQHIKI